MLVTIPFILLFGTCHSGARQTVETTIDTGEIDYNISDILEDVVETLKNSSLQNVSNVYQRINVTIYYSDSMKPVDNDRGNINVTSLNIRHSGDGATYGKYTLPLTLMVFFLLTITNSIIVAHIGYKLRKYTTPKYYSATKSSVLLQNDRQDSICTQS